MNQIIIKNFKIFAYHGFHNAEKLNGQNFYIDLTVNIPNIKGVESDELDETVSYSEIMSTVKNTVQSKSYNLIEKLASSIIRDLFLNFEKIEELDIVVKKPEAPINENFEYVAVRLVRKRSDMQNDGSCFIIGE